MSNKPKSTSCRIQKLQNFNLHLLPFRLIMSPIMFGHILQFCHLISSCEQNQISQNQETKNQNVDDPDDRNNFSSTAQNNTTTNNQSAVSEILQQTSIQNCIPKKMTIDCKKKIDDALLKLFTKDYQPFRVVEDEGFKDFVRLLNPNYTLPD
ncbi:zinc finger BED domain-containing protein 4-like [Aphis craccivora]|uniref:Zinc finger BED domain-containing protein 4-like n=1 Tax=Aphis craccivora TaxID=307492 RepID=A0A6G0VMQ7_APHCR|nr:zinc finger BED domain-containing protein 4-like [Aphis craccivora]